MTFGTHLAHNIGKKSLARERCGQPKLTPPNDSGHPPPPLLCIFLRSQKVIIIKENPKKLSNVDLALLVVGLFIVIGLLFLPIN